MTRKRRRRGEAQLLCNFMYYYYTWHHQIKTSWACSRSLAHSALRRRCAIDCKVRCSMVRSQSKGYSSPRQHSRRDRLVAGVKVQSRLSVETNVSQNGSFVARPSEHWQGNGHGDIDSNLTGIDRFFKFACSGAVGCEDGRAVAVLVVVDQMDRLVERLDLDDDQRRPENLLVVSLHARSSLDDRRTDKVAAGILRVLVIGSVEKNLTAVGCSRLGQGNDTLSSAGGNERATLSELIGKQSAVRGVGA